jgi:hypothetical protein
VFFRRTGLCGHHRRSRKGLVCLIYRRVTSRESLPVCLTTLHINIITNMVLKHKPGYTYRFHRHTPGANEPRPRESPHVSPHTHTPRPACPRPRPSPRPRSTTRRRGTPIRCYLPARSIPGRASPRGGSRPHGRRRRPCRPSRRLLRREGRRSRLSDMEEGNPGVRGCAVRGRKLGERCAMRRRMCMLLSEQGSAGKSIIVDAYGSAH